MIISSLGYLAVDLILSKAIGIEKEVFNENNDVNSDYRNKMRRLYLSLKDKNNKELREDVVSGEIPVPKFCKMTVQVSNVYLLLTASWRLLTTLLMYGLTRDAGNETKAAPTAR